MSTPDVSRVEVTPELLADLEAKASAATAGLWRLRTDDGSLGSVDDSEGWAVAQAQIRPRDTLRAHVERKANAEHIAAASPAVVLALVERIRELESLLDSMTQRATDAGAESVEARVRRDNALALGRMSA